MNKPDINHFYIAEYLCGECGSIRSKFSATCQVCGEKDVLEIITSRSCLNYNFCMNPDCSYVSHIDRCRCPKCGGETRSCYSMIPEDHMGMPIPLSEECCGELLDEDEAYQKAMKLKKDNILFEKLQKDS